MQAWPHWSDISLYSGVAMPLVSIIARFLVGFCAAPDDDVAKKVNDIRQAFTIGANIFWKADGVEASPYDQSESSYEWSKLFLWNGSRK